MNYYEVLPLKNTGGESQTFTYEFSDEILIGSMVQIPLRNLKPRGLIFEKVSKPKYKTRSIQKVLSSEPVLTVTQLWLAKQISEYYLSPLSDTISAILSFDFGKKRRALSGLQPKTQNLQPNLELTPEQKNAFKAVKESKPGSKHLLFGVTGSGKTEVYLQLVAAALKERKQSIILIPEISLTPQTFERFKERFGEKVAVWHSHLKETEKFATWEKIKNGDVMIVLGARSAIFSPFEDLGYVIIDEEHESSFKQDKNPRYETTQVAEWLVDRVGAKLVLGSATPRVETFKKATEGKFHLHRLEKRIAQEAMPPVRIIDLGDEFRKGNKSIFSEALHTEIEKTLKKGKQIILFVNRRGAATFVVCRDCGHTLECPNCEIPLTYHPQEGEKLTCHHCNFRMDVPAVCPKCKSYAIKYFGLGTQKVEIEAKKLFPKARIARMDRDTTKKRGSHEQIFTDFKSQNFDILIGTQLIAKGWDLPNVELVGVISADTMLNIPDFRSAERTFALLTQVAGRTGRGYHPGQVILQTYSPENYSIKTAAKHNYEDFYAREITSRKKYGYPPFSNLIKLTFSAKKEETVIEKTAEMEKMLSNNFPGLNILGPSPAFIPRLAGNIRWHIILKVSSEAQFNLLKQFLRENYHSGWTYDVNPENLL